MSLIRFIRSEVSLGSTLTASMFSLIWQQRKVAAAINKQRQYEQHTHIYLLDFVHLSPISLLLARSGCFMYMLPFMP
jgi:hypothetical protein